MNDRFRRFLLNKAMRQFGQNWDDAENMVQEAYALMLSREYDPTRGTPTTFAVFQLRSAISNQIRKMKAVRRDAHGKTHRLGEIHRFVRDKKQQTPDQVAEKKEFAAGVRKMVSSVADSRDTRIIWNIHEDGLLLKEIGTGLGVSRQAVDQQLKRSYSKLASRLSVMLQ